MRKWVRLFVGRAALRALRHFLISTILKSYRIEEAMACEHKDSKGETYSQAFCPDCGTQLKDEAVERFAARIRADVERILDERGIKKPEKAKEDDDTPPKNELERLLGKKKKKQ